MTNSGGGDASDPLRPVGPGGVDRASRARGIDHAAGAEGVEGAAGASAVDPAGEATAVRGPDAIAEALAAGRIDPAAARALLIDEAVAAALPPGADPAMAAELRAEIEAVLAADPTLERLLTP
jgi:hypothetical protein